MPGALVTHDVEYSFYRATALSSRQWVRAVTVTSPGAGVTVGAALQGVLDARVA